MIDVENIKNARPSLSFLSGENRKKTLGVLSVVVILIVTGIVILFLGQNQDTRSRATAGDPVKFYLDPEGAITKAPGEKFTAKLYLNTGNDNNISAVAPVITSSDGSVLQITGFIPETNNPPLNTVIVNKLENNNTYLRYIVVNKSIDNVLPSPNILLGTIELTAGTAGTAKLRISTETRATNATFYDSAISLGLPINNILDNTDLATVTVAVAVVAAPTCEVSFTFPQAITPNTDVPITVTQAAPVTSDSVWEYSTLYELDNQGQVIGSLGGCPNNICNLPAVKNTTGAHRVQFAVRDEETYGTDKKLPGQTEQKIWCKTQGNDTFTTGAATSANPAVITAPAGWGGPTVSYALSPQDPKAGQEVTITLQGRGNPEIQYTALLIDGTPQWASSGGGSDGTTWKATFGSTGAHTVQLAGCDGTAYQAGTLTCTDASKQFNSGTINVSP